MIINEHQKRILVTLYNSMVDQDLPAFETTVTLHDLYEWCYPNQDLDHRNFLNQIDGLYGLSLITYTPGYVGLRQHYTKYITDLANGMPIPFHNKNPKGVTYA